jgi:hypothetical protein
VSSKSRAMEELQVLEIRFSLSLSIANEVEMGKESSHRYDLFSERSQNSLEEEVDNITPRGRNSAATSKALEDDPWHDVPWR